eukprot:3515897-Pleurochrysis_carterae.AAC.3
MKTVQAAIGRVRAPSTGSSFLAGAERPARRSHTSTALLAVSSFDGDCAERAHALSGSEGAQCSRGQAARPSVGILAAEVATLIRSPCILPGD